MLQVCDYRKLMNNRLVRCNLANSYHSYHAEVQFKSCTLLAVSCLL